MWVIQSMIAAMLAGFLFSSRFITWLDNCIREF
jgi:hypothetical protein